jgi:Ca2+/H+ antiporter
MSSVTSAARGSIASGRRTDHRPAQTGRALLVVVVVVTIVVPVLLDAVILRGAHIDNPAWLPHAKLHAAMSFLAPVALGAGSLMCLLARPVTDRFAMTIGAYLAGAFWLVVLGAGCWPGTSYFFVGDPVYGDPLRRPETLGMPDNVATSVLLIVLVLLGLALVLGGRGSPARS